MKHAIPNYIMNPPHPITITLVGLGGTGSIMLTNLAKINKSLLELGGAGIYVTAYDDDIVSEANIGRQMFSECDLGLNKATVLVERVNRFFNTNFQAVPTKYTGGEVSNITITCVDTIKSRLQVINALRRCRNRYDQDYPYYWLDTGNDQFTGQVILGTVRKKGIEQPKGDYKAFLPTIIDKYPEFKTQQESNAPSCGLAEALMKQDLFINPMIATMASNLVWKLFTRSYIESQGAFVNLDTMKVNPIKIENENNTKRKSV